MKVVIALPQLLVCPGQQQPLESNVLESTISFLSLTQRMCAYGYTETYPAPVRTGGSWFRACLAVPKLTPGAPRNRGGLPDSHPHRFPAPPSSDAVDFWVTFPPRLGPTGGSLPGSRSQGASPRPRRVCPQGPGEEEGREKLPLKKASRSAAFVQRVAGMSVRKPLGKRRSTDSGVESDRGALSQEKKDQRITLFLSDFDQQGKAGGGSEGLGVALQVLRQLAEVVGMWELPGTSPRPGTSGGHRGRTGSAHLPTCSRERASGCWRGEPLGRSQGTARWRERFALSRQRPAAGRGGLKAARTCTACGERSAAADRRTAGPPQVHKRRPTFFSSP